MTYFKAAALVLHVFFHRTNVHSHRIPTHLLVLVVQSFHGMEYCYDHIWIDTVNLVLVAIDIAGRQIKQIRQLSFTSSACFLKPSFYVPFLFLCASRIFRMEKREDNTSFIHSSFGQYGAHRQLRPTVTLARERDLTMRRISIYSSYTNKPNLYLGLHFPKIPHNCDFSQC